MKSVIAFSVFVWILCAGELWAGGFEIVPAEPPPVQVAFVIVPEKAVTPVPVVPVAPQVKDEDNRDWSKGIPRSHWHLANQKKTVFLWVGYKCPSSAKQVDGIHVHLDSLQDHSGAVVTRPCVYVLKPDGKGWFTRENIIEAKDCCATALVNGPRTSFAAPRGGG